MIKLLWIVLNWIYCELTLLDRFLQTEADGSLFEPNKLVNPQKEGNK